MLSLRTSSKDAIVRPQRWAEFRGVVVGLVFVVTVLAFQPYGLDQFVAPKVLVMVVGAPLVFGLVAAGRQKISADLILVGAAMTFLAWSISIPLIDARNSLLHGLGALEISVIMALFVGTLGVRQAGPRAEMLLIRLLALPSMIVAPLAVAQRLGIDPLRLILDLSSTRPGRWQVLTTLGNPTWTAEYLVLCFPLVLIAWKPSDRFRGVWLSAVGIVFIAAVAVTGSRGGLLGLAVAVAFGRRFKLIPRVGTIRSAAVCGVVIVLLLATAVGIGRIADLKPLTGRVGLWMAGVHLVAQKPLTGSGLRHTNLILPEGLEPVVAGLSSSHHGWLPTLVVDRLDQDWLQVAVEQGLPAVLLLIVVWLRAVVLSVRRFRSKGGPVDAAVIVVLAVSAVFACFSAPLHTPATAALFWIVAGLAATLPQAGPRDQRRQRSRWPVLAVIAGAGSAVVVGATVAAPFLEINSEAGEGHRQVARGRYREAADTLTTVVAGAPWLVGASIDRSRALIATGEAPEALVLLDDAEKWSSSEWIWVCRAQALQQLGLDEEARRALETALAVVPRSPVVVEAWSEIVGSPD